MQQWLFCLLGIVLVALGVSVEVMAGLVTTAGEGIVLAVCRVAPIRFGNMKMIFDLTLVLLSVVLGLLCLGKLSGVREGTIAAAILVGQITKQTNRLTKRLESAVLSGGPFPPMFREEAGAVFSACFGLPGDSREIKAGRNWNTLARFSFSPARGKDKC